MKAQSARKSVPPEASAGSETHSRIRSPEWNCDWIPSLAEPYLRGYTPQFEKRGSLLGYRFLAAHSASSSQSGKRVGASQRVSSGFFIGYLLDSHGMAFLKPKPPEFLVFCFMEPLDGSLHQRLVNQPDSLMRRTAEYIRWLTHRPPRFELFIDQHAALVRHVPTEAWPPGRTEHYARNFTIETLAWLVRSALVRRLTEELASSPLFKRRAARKSASK